jgi:hypothetical protein
MRRLNKHQFQVSKVSSKLCGNYTGVEKILDTRLDDTDLVFEVMYCMANAAAAALPVPLLAVSACLVWVSLLLLQRMLQELCCVVRKMGTE